MKLCSTRARVEVESLELGAGVLALDTADAIVLLDDAAAGSRDW